MKLLLSTASPIINQPNLGTYLNKLPAPPIVLFRVDRPPPNTPTNSRSSLVRARSQRPGKKLTNETISSTFSLIPRSQSVVSTARVLILTYFHVLFSLFVFIHLSMYTYIYIYTQKTFRPRIRCNYPEFKKLHAIRQEKRDFNRSGRINITKPVTATRRFRLVGVLGKKLHEILQTSSSSTIRTQHA